MTTNSSCTAKGQKLLLKVVSHVQLVPRFVHCHSFDTTVLVQAAKFSNERQTLLATIERLIAGGPAQNADWTGTSFSHRQGTAGTSSAAQAPSAARASANDEEYLQFELLEGVHVQHSSQTLNQAADG